MLTSLKQKAGKYDKSFKYKMTKYRDEGRL